jgi:hypothetical protein
MTGAGGRPPADPGAEEDIGTRGHPEAGPAVGKPAPAARPAGAVVQYALLAGPLLSMVDSSIVNVAAAPVA